MNRIALAFLVMAATGGCLGMDRDPYEDDAATRRGGARQPWMNDGQQQWNKPVGKPTSFTYDYLKPTGASKASNSTPPTTTAKDAKDTVKTAKASTKSKDSEGERSRAGTAKDDKVVQAIHTTTKAEADAKTRSVETPAPPVNLGVLRLTNNSRLTFRYEINDLTSVELPKIEIWGTTDQRTWKKYEATVRAPGSFAVDVKDEGLYGFTMVARRRDDRSKPQPPQAGEPPQAWVIVDRTKPDVQLLGAELSVTARTPTVVVRWTAKDAHFGARPIALLYAERLEGPWTPISVNLPNTGQYEWVTPRYAPPRLYVRVQASDLMGNVSIAQTARLHIPVGALPAVSGPSLSETPRLSSVPPPLPVLEPLKPISAVSKPTAKILSVDAE